MFRVVLFQFATSLAAAALAAMAAGMHAALSALAGGLACTVPNALLAAQMRLASRKLQYPAAGGSASGAGSPGATLWALSILLGELFKVILTVATLALIGLAYRQLVWPALLLAVCAVLMIQPAAYAGRRS